MDQTYHTARGYFYRIVGALAVAVGLLAMVPFVWADARPGTKTIAVTVCVSVSFFIAGVCTWGLMRSLRHELRVSDEAVETCGLGGTTRLVLDEVREARWGRLGESRTLKLDGPQGKLKINFLFYDRRARRELIRFFRQRIPEARQRDWERFSAASRRLLERKMRA